MILMTGGRFYGGAREAPKEHAHIIAHDFLDIQLIFDPKKFWKAET